MSMTGESTTQTKGGEVYGNTVMPSSDRQKTELLRKEVTAVLSENNTLRESIKSRKASIINETTLKGYSSSQEEE
eukprot:2291204-Ditylum_brightwellii.AAC.1